MTNPDYSIFNKDDEILAMDAIRCSLKPGGLGNCNTYTTISVAAAVFVMDTIYNTPSKHLNPRNLPQSVATAEAESIMSNMEIENRIEIYRREVTALSYIGHGASNEPAIVNDIQINQARSILRIIMNFQRALQRVVEAEKYDLPDEDLYGPLDEAVLSVRRASVEWLENHQRDCWNHPITHACRDISDLSFALLTRLDNAMLKSEGWRRFRSGTSILLNKCNSPTRR